MAVAYFSMEVGLRDDLPTYAGGLGMLAGDMLRAAADSGLPLVGVTLLHRKGYFRQQLDDAGHQSEAPVTWSPERTLAREPATAQIALAGRDVHIAVWRFDIVGVRGAVVPVYLLDTDLPANHPEDRVLTDRLYGGDSIYRLRQEVVLGIGGVHALRASGRRDLSTYHMNEGHAALLTLALLEELAGSGPPSDVQLESVRSRCVFTTHTPVPAGHDQFPLDAVAAQLGESRVQRLRDAGCCLGSTLNMTHLALRLSRYVNGVAMRHGQISRDMFPGYPVASITNGVHAATWASPSMAALFDRHLPIWRRDNISLRYAAFIAPDEIAAAHGEAKQVLLAEVARRTGRVLDPAALTIGFARRATRYKAFELVLSDLERLMAIHRDVGPIQILYAGKAHPADDAGRDMIRGIVAAARTLSANGLQVLYLEDYDWSLGRLMTAGSDLWLNTPHKPQEASGTSGMKAAINGVPSFSVLDGWWVEGHVEGVTGWAIGADWPQPSDPDGDAAALYDKLAQEILPAFYRRPQHWREIMRSTIALNGAFFNAQRMAWQYMLQAYAG